MLHKGIVKDVTVINNINTGSYHSLSMIKSRNKQNNREKKIAITCQTTKMDRSIPKEKET